jgi:hypothetical protein
MMPARLPGASSAPTSGSLAAGGGRGGPQVGGDRQRFSRPRTRRSRMQSGNRPQGPGGAMTPGNGQSGVLPPTPGAGQGATSGHRVTLSAARRANLATPQRQLRAPTSLRWLSSPDRRGVRLRRRLHVRAQAGRSWDILCPPGPDPLIGPSATRAVVASFASTGPRTRRA